MLLKTSLHAGFFIDRNYVRIYIIISWADSDNGSTMPLHGIGWGSIPHRSTNINKVIT
jgi:hypothetical protein